MASAGVVVAAATFLHFVAFALAWDASRERATSRSQGGHGHHPAVMRRQPLLDGGAGDGERALKDGHPTSWHQAVAHSRAATHDMDRERRRRRLDLDHEDADASESLAAGSADADVAPLSHSQLPKVPPSLLKAASTSALATALEDYSKKIAAALKNEDAAELEDQRQRQSGTALSSSSVINGDILVKTLPTTLAYLKARVAKDEVNLHALMAQMSIRGDKAGQDKSKIDNTLAAINVYNKHIKVLNESLNKYTANLNDALKKKKRDAQKLQQDKEIVKEVLQGSSDAAEDASDDEEEKKEVAKKANTQHVVK